MFSPCMPESEQWAFVVLAILTGRQWPPIAAPAQAPSHAVLCIEEYRQIVELADGSLGGIVWRYFSAMCSQ